MKREPIPEGAPTHLIRRGSRGLPFARDDSDRWRNLQTLFYLNDSSSKPTWLTDLNRERLWPYNTGSSNNTGSSDRGKGQFFIWPDSWPKQNPLISLWSFTFAGNHDHFIAREKKERGVSKFMHKCGISASKHFNEKYGEKGAVFQGRYKMKIIDSDRYLQRVVPYVMVKNTFEMHPKGYKWAAKNFNEAWEWAIHYPFSSLGDYAGVRNSPIVETAELKKIIGTPEEFKELCRDLIMGRTIIEEDDFKFIDIGGPQA